MKRWRATVYYRTDNGPVDIEHDLDELWRLNIAVELGPHWDTIQRIEIVRINPVVPNLTIEAANDQ